MKTNKHQPVPSSSSLKQTAKEKPLDKFAEFVVKKLRDRMFFDSDMLLRGAWKAPGVQALQKKISQLGISEKKTIREIVEHIVTSGMHDLLFALQEEADAEGSIRVYVDGVEVARQSDGMHGEIFGESGWIARFSDYPQKEKDQ